MFVLTLSPALAFCNRVSPWFIFHMTMHRRVDVHVLPRVINCAIATPRATFVCVASSESCVEMSLIVSLVPVAESPGALRVM